ncbi:AAA family ATPase [Klebsiella aerogenes]
MIKLNKLTLKNFKIFDHSPYVINFNDSNLVLLDGPNGYGKTSVFDAIELGLTGNISRLISLENRQNPNDVVVAHNGAHAVEIILEFIDSNGILRTFQRKLKNKILNGSKKISRFTELWELHEIINGELTPISEKTLNDYFDSIDFSRDFLLFHYVQQEESSSFLKNNNEVQRAEELSRLFGDTRESDQHLERLNEVSNKLSSVKREVSAKISSIKELYKIDDGTSALIGNAEPYFEIFPWLVNESKTPFWDASTIPDLTEEKLNSILREVNNIKNLAKYRVFFARSRSIENTAHQKDLINLYIGYYHSQKNYEKLTEKYKIHEQVRGCLDILSSYDVLKIKEFVDIKTLYSNLSMENHNLFLEALSSLETKLSKVVGINTVYSEIIKHHDLMYRDIIRIPSESACPLCGHDYLIHDSLIHAISEHAQLIRMELSGNEKDLMESRDVFNKTYLDPLIYACRDYISKQKYYTQEEMHNLYKAFLAKDRLEKLRNWFDSEGIEYNDLLITDFPVETGSAHFSSSAENLISRIISATGNVPEGYYEADAAKVFERMFVDYFNGNQDLLNQIKMDDLEKKENYIKGLYFDSLRNVIDELGILKVKEKKLERALHSTGNIIDVVRTQIRRYRKKLITDIEIPFYIYSGKILQTHQAGLGKGIFIKDPTGVDELKNVRLVSNWKSDHDVLNTMSSGQISAIVISLTLALNKVYCNRLSSIFIDDPVQTMDDINMTSLIELLRNDFKGKQLVLSTHEDKVSRYFAYKYLKHGESVKIVNLMQRKEYIPSNRYIYRNSIETNN